MKNISLLILIFVFLGCKKNVKENLVSVNPETNQRDSINKKDNAIPKKHQVSYPINYIKIEPDSIKTDFKKDSINVNQSLWYDNIQLITGTIDNNKNGIHLIVLNSEGKILYKSKGQLDSWRYKPTLFKSNQNKRVIVINEIGAEESWGVDIQEYNNNVYREIGLLDIVALNEYEESLNVTPFIKVQGLKDSVLQFSFDQNSKIFDSESESTIQGNKLLYRFQNNKLRRVY